MARSQACCAPPRGADRRLARLLVAGLWALAAALPLLAATPASAGTAAALQLLSGSSFDVAPGQSDVIRFAAHGIGDPSGWGVTVETYNRLVDRSHFEETLNGTAVGGLLSSSPTVALSGLPTVAGGYQLTVSVSADGTVSAGGQVSARLDCTTDCPGVYPLRLELVPPGTGAPVTLLTYLVYVASAPASDPLRFAWVVPWSLPAAAADPGGTVPAPTGDQLAALAAEAGALSSPGHAGVPLTIAPEPWTLSRLEAAGRPAAATLSALAQAAAQPAHQTLVQSLVPVDGPALVSAGLAGELADQQTRARQTLAGSPLHPSDLLDDAWVSASGIDGGTLAALGGKVRYAVVPPTTVSQVTCTQTTCTQPFTLEAGGAAAPEAAFSDPGLVDEATSSDPATAVLAAHQILADLSLVYYEAPNATWDGAPTTRGLVLATPAGWSPSSAFVSALLEGLAGNPLVSAVTLSQFFAQVPAGVLDQSAVRRPADLSGDAGLPARALRTERARLSAFDAAVAGGPGTKVADSLDDLLLAAESTRLSRPAQAVSGVQAALEAQLHQLSLPAGTSIRLTAASARVPITVASHASYPVTGTLTVSSDKIEFAPSPHCRPGRPTSGGYSEVSCQLALDRSSNTVYVQMRARVSGDFHVTVALQSQGFDLVEGTLTVRSMSTSVVAVALSAGAVVVLLTWWGRTVWRGRRDRRPAHARGRPRAAS